VSVEAGARLGKLFGRLGSDQAGERANALAAIDKALPAAGLSWSWVCELVTSGTHAADEGAEARDRLLARLMADRLAEAAVGAHSLSVQEHVELRKVSGAIKETGSLRSVASADVARALDLADVIRRRVGRR
jgi:hypothetical protein